MPTDILTDVDTVLDLLGKHQELTTRQLKTKTGFSGNRLDEALQFLKRNSRIFMATDATTGVTHWRLNRAEPEPAQPDSPAAKSPHIPPVFPPMETRATTSPRKPYTPNRVNGFYRYRGNIVVKLDRRASARSVTLSPADLTMITSLMREDAP